MTVGITVQTSNLVCTTESKIAMVGTIPNEAPDCTSKPYPC